VITQEYYDVIQSRNRDLHIRMFLYNSTFRKIGSLEGVCLGGNISISSESDIRRTANISLVISNSSFLVGSDKKIWINRWIQIELGIKNTRTNNIIWFNQGFYMPNTASVRYSATDKTLSLECLDPMILLTEKKNGELGISTEITANTPIVDAIRGTVSLITSNKLILENSNRVIPYDIRVEANTTVYSLVKQITDIFLDYEVFYDVDGNFRYQKVKSGVNDPIVMNFEQLTQKLVIDADIQMELSNVRNKIIIWGMMNESTGVQVTYTKTNNDSTNKFSVPNLGELKRTIVDKQIQTLESAQTWADFYMYKHSNLCEKLVLSCLPIYFLDANQKIYYKNNKMEVDGEFLITNLDIPLDNSLMKISGVKVY
jgi:hypothetical protein